MKTFTQFILERESYVPDTRVEQISAEDFPFELGDIISCETKLLGGCDGPEDTKHVKQVRDTAEIVRIEKVFGYDSNFDKSSNPDDFFYNVRIKYMGEDGISHPYVIGVNQEGKARINAN